MDTDQYEHPNLSHMTIAQRGDGDPRWMAENATLVIALQAAVPLRMLELAKLHQHQRDYRVREWAEQACDAVASHGDDLMFGSKRKGATADVFNHLAKGLAALACCPGGVTFAGLTFELNAQHRGCQRPECRPTEVVDLLAKLEQVEQGGGADG